MKPKQKHFIVIMLKLRLRRFSTGFANTFVNLSMMFPREFSKFEEIVVLKHCTELLLNRIRSLTRYFPSSDFFTSFLPFKYDYNVKST